jgi:uncharacterized membrane protein YiaA
MLPVRRDRSSDHPIVLYLEKVFWALVIVTLALLAGGLLLAPGPLLSSTVFVAVFAGLVALWGLHAAQVYTHRDALRHDANAHHVRERRGF